MFVSSTIVWPSVNSTVNSSIDGNGSTSGYVLRQVQSTWSTVSVCLLPMCNMLLLIIYAVLKRYEAKSWIVAATRKCVCHCGQQNKRKEVPLCLRILFRIAKPGFNHANLQLNFVNQLDRKLFGMTLHLDWFLRVEHLDKVSIGRLLESQQPYQLFQLPVPRKSTPRTPMYLFKANVLVDDCINYFDDIIHKRRNRKRSKKKSLTSSDELYQFPSNPNKVAKVMIKLVYPKNAMSMASVLSPNRKTKTDTSAMDDGSLRFDTLTLEIIEPDADLETYYQAELGGAPLTFMGIYYELIKFTQVPCFTRFPDKAIQGQRAVIDWAECVVLSQLVISLLGLILVLCLSLSVNYDNTGIGFYIGVAMMAAILTTVVHFLILYVFKSLLQEWLENPLRKQEQIRSTASIILWTLAISVTMLTSIFLHIIMSPKECHLWLVSLAMSLVVMACLAPINWYLLATLFGYFRPPLPLDPSLNLSSSESTTSSAYTNQPNTVHPIYNLKYLSNIFTSPTNRTRR